MIFLKGSVDSVIDVDRSGKFEVNISGRSIPSGSKINYVSPFYDPFRGGILALPAVGSEVIVAYDDALGEYYYFGTIVGKSKFSPGSDDSYVDDIAGNNRAYNKENMPAAMSFTNSDGAGLKINNYLGGSYLPTVKSVILESTQGHRLELSDSPSRDQVALKNKNQEGITITGESNAVKDARCIDIKTLNSIRTRAVQGEVRVDLTHGRDITIKNGSDGQAGGFETSSPLLGTYNPIPAGNLNLVTSYKDINIYTENTPNVISGKAGRVLISTPQGVIQLKSGSDGLTIYSEGNINIASVATTKSIRVESLGTNPLTSIPNRRGVLSSWKVQVGDEVRSGDIIAEIQPEVGPKLPVACPYNGTLTNQTIPAGGAVTFRSSIGVILTDGGDITLAASNNINLNADNRINLNAGAVDVNSTGFVSIKAGGEAEINSSESITLNSEKSVLAAGAEQVSVAGQRFVMGAAASNIQISNSAGPIYAPSPITPPSVAAPSDTPPISIIPEKGAYNLSKQP